MSFAPDLTASDIAMQWNASINKLGIEPIFPPEEDIYVGDIFAIITGAGDNAKSKTFIGTSVKLDHINVRWAFGHADDAPVFASTIKRTGEDSVLQTETEIEPAGQHSAHPIVLKIAAFPGVSIVHKTKSSALIGMGILGSAENEGDQLEEIHIPVAETYGITAPDAVAALDLWCSQSKMCSREFAERMLRFVLGTDLSSEKDGADGTRASMGLLLVYRVYAAREFDTRIIKKMNRGGSLRSPQAPPPIKSETAGQGSSSQGDSEVPETNDRRSASVLVSQSFEASEGIKQTFQQPVVFGIRSVKRDLD